MTTHHKIQPDETYLFQLIEADTGIRCPVFVSTPSKLCDYLVTRKTRLFVVTLIAVTESTDVGNLDLFLTVPIYSSLSWITTFKPALADKAIDNLDHDSATHNSVIDWLSSKLGGKNHG